MVNLIRMDLYRMFKTRSFQVCLAFAFALSLASTPLEVLLFNLAKSLAPEAETLPLPETAELSSMIRSPLALLTTLLVTLSVVFFYFADMENGYIKNIEGQMPKRGFSILSRYLASAVHNVIFMLVCAAGSIIGTMLFRKILADDGITDAVFTFFLKLLLLQSVCAVLLLVTAGLRSKSFGIVLAVLFGIGAMSLLYAGIDSALGMLIKGFVISPYMPDNLLGEGRPDTVKALLSAAVTIAVFLPLSISVFDRRDVK